MPVALQEDVLLLFLLLFRLLKDALPATHEHRSEALRGKFRQGVLCIDKASIGFGLGERGIVRSTGDEDVLLDGGGEHTEESIVDVFADEANDKRSVITLDQ